MISVRQIRAARAFLDWSPEDLAAQAGLALDTVTRAELIDAATVIRSAHIRAIQSTLEAAGIEFIPENGSGAGVRLRKGIVQ